MEGEISVVIKETTLKSTMGHVATTERTEPVLSRFQREKKVFHLVLYCNSSDGQQYCTDTTIVYIIACHIRIQLTRLLSIRLPYQTNNVDDGLKF